MEEQKPQSSKKKQSLTDLTRYSAMGFQMAAIMAVGVFCGHWLDGFLKFQFPLFTLLLTLIGVVAAIWYFVKDFIKKK